MKQRLIIGLLFTVLLLGGCNAWDKAYEQAGSASLTVASITGPAALGFVKAMEPSIDPQVRLGDTVNYSFEADEETITIVGQGSAADIVIRQLLIQAGIDPDNDLTLTYVTSAETAMENVAANDSLVLSEPWVTDLLNENSGFSIALDIQEEWMEINEDGMPLPLTCLIVKKEIPLDRAEEWNLFVEDYQDSIEWINSNPAETAELLDNHKVGITKEQATGVISSSNLGYLDATSAKPAVEKYLSLFLEATPDAINGSLPDAAFYLEQE